MNGKKVSAPSLQTALIIAAVVVLAVAVLLVLGSIDKRYRDTQRLSSVRALQNFLSLYASNNNGNYPTTLDALVPTYVPVLPVDPTSHSVSTYSYAALGSGSNCTNYHLGIALEDNTNSVLNTDSDAEPQAVCDGSAPDFSGLSSGPAGQACSVTDGTGRDSCYDVLP